MKCQDKPGSLSLFETTSQRHLVSGRLMFGIKASILSVRILTRRLSEYDAICPKPLLRGSSNTYTMWSLIGGLLRATPLRGNNPLI